MLNATTYTTEHFYDFANREIICIYPNGKQIVKIYSDRNEVLTRDYDYDHVATSVFDVAGRKETSTLENGLVTNYSFTGRQDNLVTGITVTGKDDLSFTYGYDANKNMTSETRLGLLSGTGFAAAYDAEDRVTSWTRDNAVDTQTWTHTKVGDWTNTTINGVQEDRTYNDAHELLTKGANALAYSNKGNMTTDQDANTYIWDFDNHLSEVKDSGASTIATYGYDAMGRRVTKTIGANTTVFVCNGQQVACEYDSAAATTAPSKTYIYGDYIDAPLMMVDAIGSKFYYHQNRQYSVIGITDALGDVVEMYSYTAYGETTVHGAGGGIISGSLIYNPYTFTGRRLDEETGLFYFRARYYSGEQGRFVSRDPIGFVDGPSLYAGYFGAGFGMDPHGLVYSKPELSQQFNNFIQNGQHLEQTKWFELNYAGWVRIAKKTLTRLIKLKLKKLCDKKDGDYSSQIDIAYRSTVRAKMSKPGTKTLTNPRNPSTSANEEMYGDKAQSEQWADKILGNFMFTTAEGFSSISGKSLPKWINPKYLGKASGKAYRKSGPHSQHIIKEGNEIRYTVDLVISDGLGLQRHDNFTYFLLGWAAPDKKITRAYWPLTGVIECPIHCYTNYEPLPY